MAKIHRAVFRIFALCVGLSLGISVMPVQAAPWTQATSDIPADPSVRFGTLANGMNYAIARNATPKGVVAIRFRIGAGSLQEGDDQQGLAHFLEHMAFRGSKHVKAEDVWNSLQRLGMTAGADANASTSFTETIYKLDLPHNDAATLDTGLLRMRDTAGDLTLDQGAMDAERGPILSEERLRDTARYHAYRARSAFLFGDHLGNRRLPIGLVETIRTAPIALIRRFYDAFYRPENATIVVVGDIDPDTIEAKLKTLFNDWTAAGPAGSDNVAALRFPAKPAATVFSEAGAPTYLIVNWLGAYVPENNKARQRANVIEKLGFEILNRRMQALPPGPDHPFAGAGIQFSHDFNAFNVRSVYLEIKPEEWRQALGIAIREARRIEMFGVGKDELDGVSTDFRALVQSQAAQAGTRKSDSIANEIVQSVNDGEVYTSRAESLKELDEILNDLSPAEVSLALKQAMGQTESGRSGPLVFISTPTPIEGGEMTANAALNEALAAPVVAGEARLVKPWPYTEFGAPGTVVERSEVADLGTTFVRFANGLRLTIKPTTFQSDQISVSLRMGNGRLGLPNDTSTPLWAITRGTLGDGGLADLTLEDIKRSLTGKFYGFDANLQDDALSFGGQTRPADLSTQLQVMAAYLTAPGWRNSALDSAKTEQINQLAQSSNSPSGVLRQKLSFLLTDGDIRWASPGRPEIDETTIDGLKALIDPLLTKAPLELVIVGDTDVQPAIEAVARTLGALPLRAAAAIPSKTELALHFPAPQEAPLVLRHFGRPDQGIALLAWPATDIFADVQQARDLRVLERIIQTRLTEQLRIQDGATYSPGSFLKVSDVFPGYGFLATFAELPPSKMPLFFNVVQSIASDLKAKPVSDDELDRAKKPRIVTLETAMQQNAFWVETLGGAQSDPRRLDVIRSAISGIEHVSAPDVQRVAKIFLDEGKIFRLQIEPTLKDAPLEAK